MDDSGVMGRIVIDSEDETQIDVNVDTLFLKDQRDLLDAIKDQYVSRFEVNFLIDSVRESGVGFWNEVLIELIREFRLSTLRRFEDTIMTSDRVIDIINLLKFLKCELAQHIIERDLVPLPEDRDMLVDYMKSIDAHPDLIFALETIDRDDLKHFRSKWVS